LFVYSFIVRLLFIQQPGNTHGIYHNGRQKFNSYATTTK
jgi:hypothetical protein